MLHSVGNAVVHAGTEVLSHYQSSVILSTVNSINGLLGRSRESPAKTGILMEIV